MSSWLNDQQLKEIPFRYLGENVQISAKASIYGAERIEIHDHVRIDDFCIVSAGPEGVIILSNHVHIACHSIVMGNAQIFFDEFSGVSPRCTVLSSSDDYSGNALMGPTLPDKYRKIHSAPIHIGKHVPIGASSIVMPGISIVDGAAVGAFSFVSKNLKERYLYTGHPIRKLKKRSEKIFELEQAFRAEQAAKKQL